MIVQAIRNFDSLDQGAINPETFSKCCEKFNVSLTAKDLQRINRNYMRRGEIEYKKMAQNLNLADSKQQLSFAENNVFLDMSSIEMKKKDRERSQLIDEINWKMIRRLLEEEDAGEGKIKIQVAK